MDNCTRSFLFSLDNPGVAIDYITFQRDKPSLFYGACQLGLMSI